VCRTGCEWPGSRHAASPSRSSRWKARAAATVAYEREPDAAAVADRVDEKKRRELTRELSQRLERQVTANGAT
jgi:hypothetical protein